MGYFLVAVAVFESMHSLQKFETFCDENPSVSDFFSGWIDLEHLVLSKFDKCYVKHADSRILSRLDALARISWPDQPDASDTGGEPTVLMKRLLAAHDRPESLVRPFLLSPDLSYEVVVVDIGLVRVRSTLDTAMSSSYSCLATLAAKSCGGHELTCGVDLSGYADSLIDWDSAKM